MEGSGEFTSTRISWGCSENSPMDCGRSMGELYSFGEDGNQDLYYLADNGLFRVVDNSMCTFEDSSKSNGSKAVVIITSVVAGVGCLLFIVLYFVYFRKVQSDYQQAELSMERLKT